MIAQAFRHGLSVDEVERACSYEPWFLRQIEEIVAVEAEVRAEGLLDERLVLRQAQDEARGGANETTPLSASTSLIRSLSTDEGALKQARRRLSRLKAMGFSDARLAALTGRSEAEVRAYRHALGVRPVFKRVDTCAAEFEARTPYMYSTYEAARSGSRRRTRASRQTVARRSSWAAARTGSGRASSSTTAAATPPSPWPISASSRSW